MGEFKFLDLPEQLFPMKMEFFTKGQGVVYTVDVDGPGAVEIPGLANEFGEPVAVRVTYGDGTEMVEVPPAW